MFFVATERRKKKPKRERECMRERSEELNTLDPTYDIQFDSCFHCLNSRAQTQIICPDLHFKGTYKMFHVNQSIPNKFLILAVSIK